VALARALVQEPTVTLLDEPLSHLDAKLRHKLRGEIRRLLAARASPTVWSTPDAMEALCIGDRIAVIEAGHIEQIGAPEEIWLRPATVRVARLVGDPPMNLLPGRLELEGPPKASFVRASLRVPLSAGLAKAAVALGADAPVILGVRPHLVGVVPADGPSAVDVELYSHEPFGKYAIVTVRLGDLLIKAKTSAPAPAGIGARVGLALPPAGFVLFNARTGNAIASDVSAALEA
jgi:multiple sugar transport system ATP-binding protein